MSDIFISYAHEDGADVTAHIVATLREHGYEVWSDEKISVGNPWRREIIEEIYFSSVIVIVYTSAALTSKWVEIECNLALGLGKTILPLLVGTNPEDLPSILEGTQASTIDVDTLNLADVIEEITRHVEPNRNPGFWRQLLMAGVDIIIPREKCAGDHYDVRPDWVNVFTLNTALYLQKDLLRRSTPFARDRVDDSVQVLSIDKDGRELRQRQKRNWIILGGPGGVPYVETLLVKWTGFAARDTFSGYRYFARPDLDHGGAFVLGVDNAAERGIQDTQNGIASGDLLKPTGHKGEIGDHYAVCYTHGFGGSAFEDDPPTIILSPFERRLLRPLVEGFLLNDSVRRDWLEQVRSQGGRVTETLLIFSEETTLKYVAHHPVRNLGLF
ncbi:MAG: toll/interleukin-1 receptor domain-containing protein [Anaerolineae bacterium]|nr:toll/interleukin-1 receptor domain-containing protein [Anaerolineae bacterium]